MLFCFLRLIIIAKLIYFFHSFHQTKKPPSSSLEGFYFISFVALPTSTFPSQQAIQHVINLNDGSNEVIITNTINQIILQY